MSKPQPVTVFLSYAHEDESLRSELETHLSLLQRQGLISTWQDRRIMAGTDWAEVLDEHLNGASIILLLVSADFLASDYCYGVEMQCALNRDKAGQARVIPIMVRPCDKKGAPFAHLQALPTDAKAITTWNNRDEAWTNVAAGIRRVIEELPTHALTTPLAALPPIWNVPYPQNSLFTGREELLTQLATTLHTDQPTALSQPQAINGLGGIGKTQLALEYAYRSRADYQAVLWAQAETRENLTSSYLTIAALLNLPEKSEQESARVIAAVKNWLQRNTGWLLILDNADDLALARDFLPPSPGGHVLLRRAGLLPTDATIEQASEHDRSIGRAICEEVGGLPLALDQAGAYIEETGCSLAEYQRLYQRRRADLLAERRGQLVDDHPLPVATTWSLSFAQVEQNNPAAADLLRLCAFLAPDAIPEEIITEGAEHLGPNLAPVGADSYLLNQAIEALRAYSLLSRDPHAHMLSVHRLVQATLKDQMDEQDRQQWAERTVRAVNAAFPGMEFETWPQCERCLPHGLICAEMVEQENLLLLEAASLLHQTGTYLIERARSQEAQSLLQQALAIRKQKLGSQSVETANTLDRLARCFENQGKDEQAKPLFQRALAIREQQLGPEHPNTANSVRWLAVLSEHQQQYEQAASLYQRALSIYEHTLGLQHPDTQNIRANYASLLRTMGHDAEAAALDQP